MKQNIQYHISHNPTLYALMYIFIFFLVFKGCFCSDPWYEACVPKDCGDGMIINYPFYINGLQDPNCGYPGFQLICNIKGSPVLQISNNSSYLVKEIDYDKQSMRVVINTQEENMTCLLNAFKNLTLDPNRFVSITTSQLNILTNCSKLMREDLVTRYRINGSCKPDIDQLVMLENDASFRNVTQYCSVVRLPVEVSHGEVLDGGNYEEVVERGFTMTWLASDCSGCKQSGGRCGFNTTSYQFRCFCQDRPRRVSCPPTGEKENRTLVILVTALGAGVATILVVITICLKRKYKRGKNSKNHVNVENFLRNHEFLAPKRYSYSQVKKMTNSFEVKLGQGGFGAVYKGVLSNGNLVAVKVLNEFKGSGEDFINEVASVGQTSHVNIVSLVGFCFAGHHRALIYEFMPNGSLERFIDDKGSSSNNQLGWKTLHQIAIGVARGLEYLHSGCNTRILHFDIKPHNILLDNLFCPKISDFGLAKIFPEKRSRITMSHMRGTPGYIAPEVFSRNFGGVSHKSDVYSYGMMILEMVGGRNNTEVEVDHTSEIYFPDWLYKKVELDENYVGLHGIVSDEENVIAKKMIIVGLWCIQTNPLSRPTITKVLEMLEGDVELLEIPPKPYMSSPARCAGSPSSTVPLHPSSSSTNIP